MWNVLNIPWSIWGGIVTFVGILLTLWSVRSVAWKIIIVSLLIIILAFLLGYSWLTRQDRLTIRYCQHKGNSVGNRPNYIVDIIGNVELRNCSKPCAIALFWRTQPNEPFTLQTMGGSPKSFQVGDNDVEWILPDIELNSSLLPRGMEFQFTAILMTVDDLNRLIDRLERHPRTHLPVIPDLNRIAILFNVEHLTVSPPFPWRPTYEIEIPVDAGAKDLSVLDLRRPDMSDDGEDADMSTEYPDIARDLRSPFPDLSTSISAEESRKLIIEFDNVMAMVVPALNKDPGDEQALLTLAKTTPLAIRLGKKEVACRLARDWHAYEQLTCKHVSLKVVRAVLPYIDSLNTVCGSKIVDAQKLSECLIVYP